MITPSFNINNVENTTSLDYLKKMCNEVNINISNLNNEEHMLKELLIEYLYDYNLQELMREDDDDDDYDDVKIDEITLDDGRVVWLDTDRRLWDTDTGTHIGYYDLKNNRLIQNI